MEYRLQGIARLPTPSQANVVNFQEGTASWVGDPGQSTTTVSAYGFNISRLQEAERATRDCDAQVRQAKRTEHAAPLLAEFGSWLEGETFLPKSLIGKAATYTRNQWTALNRYIEDGDLRAYLSH